MSQKLYIMTGLPYSGKTMFANELVKRFGFEIASVDDVINEKDYDVEDMPQEQWNIASSIYLFFEPLIIT